MNFHSCEKQIFKSLSFCKSFRGGFKEECGGHDIVNIIINVNDIVLVFYEIVPKHSENCHSNASIT